MTIDALEDAMDEVPRLAVAIDLVRQAGHMALDRFPHAQVSWKADESMVTTPTLKSRRC